MVGRSSREEPAFLQRTPTFLFLLVTALSLPLLHPAVLVAASDLALPGGRALPADFKPGKVVYAILMEDGRQLTPDTLFPFSQATLAHAARILGTYGIDVEVAAIPAA